MSLFKVDSKQAEGKEFDLLPEGEYEVFPVAGETSTSSNGNPMLTVNYRIRDDVDQAGKGQEIRFDRFVGAEKAMFRYHAANKALGTEDGVEFEDFADWWNYFKGKAIRVVVKHKPATVGKNAGKLFPEVVGFKPSTVGGEIEILSAKTDSNGQIDISDDDLPF